MKRTIYLLTACFFTVCVTQLHAQTQWFDPLKQEFPTVQGRWWQDELKESYHRMPERFKGKVPDAVWGHALKSAGLSIMFRTAAPEITVRYTTGVGTRQAFHWPFTGSGGVDLYATDQHGTKLWCRGKYTQGDTILVSFANLSYREVNKRYGYEFELFLPPYIETKWLEIGVPQGEKLTFLPVTREKPIVFYGTSIAHGGCASRPGMMWINMLRREMMHPTVSLGFSGSGKLEPEVFDAIAEIDANAFVIDCMPNMGGRKDIAQLMISGVRKIRKQSAAPILLVAHAGYPGESSSDKDRDTYTDTNRQLDEAYASLRKSGVPEVYLLPHEEFFLGLDETVDGTHPNDLGMRHLADQYEKKLRAMLHEVDGDFIFQPITQQRDQYDWRARHEAVLEMAHGTADVVMIGNSITHFWSGLPKDDWHRGDDSWASLFGSRRVINMGFGWDRIENVLWRIYHGELDGYKAKKICMMLGTNNFHRNTPQEIVRGVMQVVAAVHRRQPTAEIYVQGIYPRRGAEQAMKQLNEDLEETLYQTFGAALGKQLRFINPGEVLLDAEGKLREELFTGDGLHPCDKGYRLLGEHLKKDLGL